MSCISHTPNVTLHARISSDRINLVSSCSNKTEFPPTMRLSSDQCNHTVYLFSNAASKQPALTPTKLRSSTLSCALCSAGSWQGPSPLVNPCTAVPCSLACRKHMSHREKSQATSSVQEATKRCSTTVSKSSKPVAELRSQHWALGLNLLCIFSLLQPGNRTN